MIPKLIHQTYKSADPENLPQLYREGQMRILALHPDWDYKFWTDETMEAEMRDAFPEIYEVWCKLPRMIMRIDVFRYCLMLKYGGLYADMDYHFSRPFDLLENSIVLPISRNQSKEKYPKRFGNCVFASEPGHPFWRFVLDDIVTRQERFQVRSDEDVMDGEFGTGPGFLTRMIYECPKEMRAGLTMPDRWLFHPLWNATEAVLKEKNPYGRHVCASLWRDGAL
jgi:hypothetical protein